MKGVTLLNATSPNNFPTIRTCQRCHKLLTYSYGSPSLCPECIDKDKDDYSKVKEYIQSHANTTVFEVSQVTGVNLKVIMQFVREDRVQIVDTKNKINLKE